MSIPVQWMPSPEKGHQLTQNHSSKKPQMVFCYPERLDSADFTGLSSGALPRMQLLPSSNPKWLAESPSSTHSRCSVTCPAGSHQSHHDYTNEKTVCIGLKTRKMFSDLLLAARDLSWNGSKKRPISSEGLVLGKGKCQAHILLPLPI